ncbi:hypothetical protein LEP1GSC161_0913 [Leptospira santarosai str. CBC1416]|uniref:Uncharacterized protein n=1 Tax=Leptospira santarosai str. CBC1416 TaxID=1193059 RepID=M6VIR8_9LEPT|nr:hypothetical protein LEP1GSC161_0913 [Leptospira santarosai str. CBC1416]
MGRVWKLSETLSYGSRLETQRNASYGSRLETQRNASYGSRLETQRNAFLWVAFQVLIESLSNPKITS